MSHIPCYDSNRKQLASALNNSLDRVPISVCEHNIVLFYQSKYTTAPNSLLMPYCNGHNMSIVYHEHT